MISNRKDLARYLEEKKLFKSYKVISRRSGLSNNNYIIETDLGKFIVRANKIKKSETSNSLEYEHHVLKFFEDKGINFVPRSFHYDRLNNIHILNYLEGRKIRFRHISPKGMSQVAKKIYEINSLATEYSEYCDKHNASVIKPHSEVEAIRGRINKRLQNVGSDNQFYKYKRWVLERMEKDFKNYSIDKNIFYLNHGDPADNLIISNKEIFIIDWEYVRFTYSPGLVHVLAHGGLNYEKEIRLLKTYAKISGIDYEELYYKTYNEKIMYYLLKIARLVDKSAKGAEEEDTEKNINKIQKHYMEKYQMVNG